MWFHNQLIASGMCYVLRAYTSCTHHAFLVDLTKTANCSTWFRNVALLEHHVTLGIHLDQVFKCSGVQESRKEVPIEECVADVLPIPTRAAA